MNVTVKQAYCCNGCGVAYMDRDAAERCCLCTECGKFVDKSQGGKYYQLGALHNECFRTREAKRELAVMETAEKLETWSGPVVWGDKYFPDVDDLVDWLHDELDPSAEWPEYTHVCTIVKFPHLDIDDVLCNLAENHEVEDFDVYDHVSEATLKLLKDAAAAFDKDLAGHEAWWPDIKRAVKLPPRPEF